MFRSAHTELEELTFVGLGRTDIELQVGALARLEAHAHERLLAALAAVDDLDDGGPDGEATARRTAKTSRHKAKRVTKTASKLRAMPRLRQKLAEGDVTDEHVAAAAEAADRVDDPDRADDELSGLASDMPADLFAKRCREWADRNEPRDKAESRYRRQRRLRSVRTGKNREGMTTIHGSLDPEAGAKLIAALDAETDRLWRRDGGRDGTPDAVRTGEQRRSDALINLTVGRSDVDTGSASARNPSPPGAHPKHQALVVIDVGRATGQDPEGRGDIIGGGPLPDSVLQRLLCDAAIAPLIVDADGQPLWLGRKVRTATPGQWAAMIARDGGCVCCGAAPAFCEAHHLEHPWPLRGRTDIDRMVLLCIRDHHELHDHDLELVSTDTGWSLQPRAGPAQATSA